MEVRCKKCNKPFRVPDEKISGKGIKFACTRCHEYVIVTKDEFERSAPSSDIQQKQSPLSPAPQLAFAQKPAKKEQQKFGTSQIRISENGFIEVRCKNCSKLFRIPDEKISGKGIKFACTRCKEYVRITRDEYDQFTTAGKAAAHKTYEELTFQPTSLSKPEPPKSESSSFSGADRGTTPIFHASSETIPISQTHETEPPPQPESISIEKTAVHADEKQKVSPEFDHPLESLVHEEKSKQSVKPDSPQEVDQAEKEDESITAFIKELASEPQPSLSDETPEHDNKPVVYPLPRESNRSRPLDARQSKIGIIILAVIVLIGIVGYGIFAFMKTSNLHSLNTEVSSVVGLQLTQVATSVDEEYGDLIIKGLVENSTEMTQTGWYIVVKVYNAPGEVINELKLLNGIQLYTKNDYEILAKRGVNIHEIKAKNPLEQGVAILPKQTASFEIRYLLPPANIAGTHPTIQPYDHNRIAKEIEEHTK
ncbi:MAG: zinc-ribbon domain-containing protein [Nitrospirota bacterium]